MDKGHLTGILFIDLSKAFNTISHASLLNKINKYGTYDQEIFLQITYSTVQYVQYKSASSLSQPVYSGVPQRFFLGPLLFILHFNHAE